MPKTLSQIIESVGNENVKVQKLTDCVVKSATKKSVTTITFQTEVIHTNDLMYGGEKSGYVGLILWLPKEKLPAPCGAST